MSGHPHPETEIDDWVDVEFTKSCCPSFFDDTRNYAVGWDHGTNMVLVRCVIVPAAETKDTKANAQEAAQ